MGSRKSGPIAGVAVPVPSLRGWYWYRRAVVSHSDERFWSAKIGHTAVMFNFEHAW
jgi:hypothetical protein